MTMTKKRNDFSTVVAHTCFLGHTGYANHARNFFTKLNNHIPVRVRNFSYDSNINYLTQKQRDMLIYQVFLDEPYEVGKGFIYDSNDKIVNIVLMDTNSPMFYQDYSRPVIFYNVWESTRQPEKFFEQMKKADQIWVPTQWQKDCTVEQGIPEEKVFVVPEGVDFDRFHPVHHELMQQTGMFKFMIFGRWEYRKYTKEMVQAFLEEFNNEENVELILSADNPFPVDEYTSTEERLEAYGLQDERIKVVHFPSDEEYTKYLQTGHCLLMASRSEGWGLPAIEALACGTPTIITDWGAPLEYGKHALKVKVKEFKKPENIYGQSEDVGGVWAEPDYDDLKDQMRFVYNNWKQCREDTLNGLDYIRRFSWENASIIAKEAIDKLNAKDYFPDDIPAVRKKLPECKVSFMQGPRIDIKGIQQGDNYRVSFYDLDNNKEVFSVIMNKDGWAQANIRYYTRWRIEVRKEDKIVFFHRFDLKNKNVFIQFDSKSMGDTIAWIPYCEKFRREHGCNVIVSCWWSSLFEKEYKHIKFVKPGTPIKDEIYAKYNLGVYHEDRKFRNPRDWRTIPLQRVASDILGLEYEEIRPFIDTRNAYTGKVKRPNKYVCISEHSTAKCKYWNNPDGWQKLVNMLNEAGYNVVVISAEETKLKGVIDATGNHIDVTMGTLLRCEFFIGLASGLAWLAWALGKKVVMISGFSEPFVEFTIDNIRIEGVGNCTGCLNDIFIPDRSWDEGCFHNKDFSCTRDIVPEMVMEKISYLIHYDNELDFTTAPILRGSKRQTTFKKFLSVIHERFDNPEIVEIGMVRKKSTEDINERAGDGNSTSIFAWYVNRYGGELMSIDINPESVNNGRENLESQGLLSHRVHLILGDGLEYLQKNALPIHGIYIDGMDYDKKNGFQNSAQFHLDAFKLAEKNFVEGTLIMFDDVLDAKTFRGKAELAVPYALSTGNYKILYQDYQIILERL